MARIAGVSADQTRDRLVAAAARVFAQRGYEGTRVGDIAREAGLTTGAIYAHYRGKGELLAEAIGAHGGRALDSLLAGGRPEAPALLEALGNDLIGRRRGRDRLKGLLILEAMLAARREPVVARLLQEGFARREGQVATAISHAQATGVLDAAVPADAVARLCMTLALGSLVVDALDIDPPDAGDWASIIHRVVASVSPGAGP